MESQSIIGHRYKVVFLGVILLAGAIACAYTFDSKLALLGDNASYYMLGKSIAQGEGYVNISKITKSPNNHYPPGYPFIISIVLLVTDSIVVVKLLNCLFMLGSLVIGFLLMARLTSNYITAFVAAMLTALNSHVLFYSSLMMSEVPYMFFSLLVLYFISEKGGTLTLWSRMFIAAIITMVIAYYVRSLGVALLAALCLHFVLNGQYRLMLVSIAAMVVGALPWFLRGRALGGASYLNQLKMINPYNPSLGEAGVGDFVDRFWNNFSRYVTREIPDAIFPHSPLYNEEISGREWLFGIILLTVITLGLIRLSHFRWLILGYMLATFGILMIWPDVWIGVRFIVPMVPLLWLGFLSGFYYLFTLIRAQSQVSSVVNYAPLILTVLLVSPLAELHKQANASYPPAWQRYFEIAEWLDKNEEGAVISCGKPSLFYTFADNYTMRYKFSRDTNELIAHLEKQQVDYVVIDQVYGNTFQYLLPAVRQHPERFKQVLHLKNPDTFLLKFD